MKIDTLLKQLLTEKKKITENFFIDTDDDDPNLQEFKIEATVRTARENKSPIGADSNGNKEPTKNNPAPAAAGGSS